MRNDSTVQVTADAVFVGYGIVAPEWGWNDYEGIDVKGQDRDRPGQRSGPQGLDDLSGKDPYLLRPLDLQDRGGPPPRRGGNPHDPHHRERHVPVDDGRSGWTGPQLRLEAPPSSLARGGLAPARCRRPAVQGTPARTWKSSPTRQLTKGFRAYRSASARCDGAKPDPALLHRKRPGTVAGPRAARASGRAYRWPLRPLWHRGGRERGLDLQWRGRQCLGTAAVLAAAEAFVGAACGQDAPSCSSAFTAEESGLLGSEQLATHPRFPSSDMAAILNLDEMNVYGKTRDFSAVGLDQSSLGKTMTQAAAAEGLTDFHQRGCPDPGLFFRSDHFSLVRAGVPGAYLQNGPTTSGGRQGGGKRSWMTSTPSDITTTRQCSALV